MGGAPTVAEQTVAAQTAPSGVPYTFRWGLQRPDLIRYNRVEGLSIGARGQLRPMTPWGPLSVSGTLRLGTGDVEPNVVLDATHETLRRRVRWRVFHELATVDEDRRHLGVGNSLTALLLGRDDGEYYRRSGSWVEWTPPAAERARYRVRLYAERHEAASTETDFNFLHVADSAWSFPDNPPADRVWEFGGLASISPRWGDDPSALRAGLDVTVRAGGGDVSYARADAGGSVVVPFPGDVSVEVAAGFGTSWGSPTVQRLWRLGGASTLRGYAPSQRVGTSFGRGRAEFAKWFSFGAVRLFSDVGWAGDRDSVRWADALYSVGAGLSLVDGLVRADGAWGLRAPREFRMELYFRDRF